jgi:pyruvate dehydrogenase E2 component (dihydrolipoamide acetyltransferase)
VPFEFKLPDLGEGINEAQVLTWKVAPGDAVTAFQPLCEVESAKAAVELTAPVAGRVVETRFAVGDTARRGDVLVLIDTADGAQPAAEPQGEEEWVGIVGSAPRAPLPMVSAAPAQDAPPGKRAHAAPFVRKLARERGVDIEAVIGSGPQGRVRIADVEAASEVSSAGVGAGLASETAKTPAARSIPLQGLRRAIADHMVEAWRNAPQVTSMDFFDVTDLVRARELLQPSAQAEGARLTYLPFFVKAAIEALRAVPEANAVVGESAIELKDEYHIGIATAITGGLVVPVVRHADQLSLVDLAREIERLVAAARERKSAPADLSGSTFTITSFGGLPGSPLFATPIVNYPEVAILGLGRVDLQPRVVDGTVVARQCIGVSFTFDHRVLDGEGAGRFMAALKRYVEQPLELLLHLR